MKVKMHIYFSSVYGSTKQYAEELARRLGTTAQEIPDSAEVPDDAAEGPIIVLAPAHGPMNAAAKFVKSLPEATIQARPMCVVTVGMTLDHVVQETDPTAELLGDRADQVQRFYLPGRLNYSELTTAHLGVMRGIVGALKLKPRKSENERSMIEMYKKDTDRVDLSRLDEIVAWAEAAKDAQNN
ncbi:flavodoxin domain-containing protein [Corynebacterium hadale]|uniref:flavodoxin domain-containing protein n=2 Tax=Corynebacterium hadale TaxID=2026255 RepID=UPI001EF23452|nr:flavodoxin domain-containing protein [Corynebacterium hadale]MCG7254918.1 flavodoxin domain-containing protein [Corynebacterium hadale]MCG7256414.1 flavodoxin domain-containing protein [Corynebacterium hadale]